MHIIFPAQQSIIMRLDVDQDQDLQVVAKALLAMDKAYRHYIERTYGHGENYKAEHLLLHRVGEGSQIFEVVSYVMSTAGFLSAEAFTTLGDFYGHMRSVIAYLSGSSSKRPNLTVQDLVSVIEILDTLNDRRGGLSINIQGNLTIVDSQIAVSHGDASRAKVVARQEIDLLQAPVQTPYTAVSVLFHQLSRSRRSMKGDKVIIPDIHRAARDVIWSNMELKSRVMDTRSTNPFCVGFVADVTLVEIEGKPPAYMIDRLISEINIPDDTLDGYQQEGED